jgi:threonine dehydrogenase-like Zn-dependent dehydrogenase
MSKARASPARLVPVQRRDRRGDRAIADGSLAIGPIVAHTFPVSEAPEAFAVTADASVPGKALSAFRSGRR